MNVTFRVYGIAQPKGSTRAFVIRNKHRLTGDEQTRAVTTSDNPKLKQWELLVAACAQNSLKMLPLDDRRMETLGVSLTVWCYLPRPRKYVHHKFKLGPTHVTKPDLDKLARAVADALTGVLWRDDAQVIEIIAHKRYVQLYDGKPDLPHIDVHVQSATIEVHPTPRQPLFQALDEPRA